MRFILRQVGRCRSLFAIAVTVNHREIFLLGRFPLILQGEFRFGVLGEDDYPGGLPVEPVYDENSGPRLAVALADIIGKNEVSRSGLLPIGRDGEETRWFIHDEDVAILVKDRDPSRQALRSRPGMFAHG